MSEQQQQQQYEIDEELDGSGYSGTFRWKASSSLPNMPPISRLSSLLEPFQLNLDRGWRNYFLSRGQYSSFPGAIDSDDAGDYLVNYALKNLCLVDCMSFPLTIAHILSRCNGFDGTTSLGKYKTINILCTGCSQRAEERILRQTNAFEELLFLLPGFQHINLWLIGPEISETKPLIRKFSYNDRKISFNLFQGGMGQFFRSNSSYLSGNSVVFGFNCGFGNFENPLPKKFDLLLSWISDLFFLTGTQLPLFFTCANHYADVSGEISIMYHILGASLILLPQENSFSFASTLIPPETQWGSKGGEPTEFSRGNSYFYGVQHCDKQRRKRINVNVEEKSRILGSLISYLTEKIAINQLTESLVRPSIHFELANDRLNAASCSIHTEDKILGISTDTTSDNEHIEEERINSSQCRTSNLAEEEMKAKDSKSTESKKKSFINNNKINSAVSSSAQPSSVSVAITSSIAAKDGKSTSSKSPIANSDFFSNFSKISGSHSGPGSTRSCYSSKSNSPGTGLRNESKLLATIMAAKIAAASPQSNDSPAIANLSELQPQLLNSQSESVDQLVNVLTLNPLEANLAEINSLPSKEENGTTAICFPSSKDERRDMKVQPIVNSDDTSLVQIEQTVLLESKRLQILIKSSLAPPHQLQVNTLALNLHTSGLRLRLSTPAATNANNADSPPYYSREIVLFHKVKCSVVDLEAKYSRKKNQLTVKIALNEEDSFLC